MINDSQRASLRLNENDQGKMAILVPWQAVVCADQITFVCQILPLLYPLLERCWVRNRAGRTKARQLRFNNFEKIFSRNKTVHVSRLKLTCPNVIFTLDEVFFYWINSMTR